MNASDLWTDADYIRTVEDIAQDTIAKYPRLGILEAACWRATRRVLRALSISTYKGLKSDVLAQMRKTASEFD